MSDESEAIKETAKATQEVAKTSAKAIDAVTSFGGFISKYIEGSLAQGIGIFEDKLKYMRWERQQRLMLRATEFMRQLDITEPTKAIPLKYAVPLLEGASLEDDDELQDLWAKLLVNAATATGGFELKRVYIDILERITPLEAQILSVIYSLPFEEIHHNGVLTAKLPQAAEPGNDTRKDDEEEPSDEVKLAIASLASIGCLAPTRTWGGGEAFASINPTVLGKSFVEACTLKNESNQRVDLTR